MTSNPQQTQLVPRPATDATVPAPPTGGLLGADGILDVDRIVRQVEAIHRLMREVMKPGEHYGVIPGTGLSDADKRAGKKDKPTLLQPGADLLMMLFRYRPEYEVIRMIETDTHLAYTVRCRLIHIPTGECHGEGIGSANSREKKYLNQSSGKVCPNCQQTAIIASRFDEGGWYCYDKKGGCKSKFKKGDPQIEDQKAVPVTEAVWDLHNTITKIANKRSKNAAILTATAASSAFTQDREPDDPDTEDDPEPRGYRQTVTGGGGNGGKAVDKEKTPLPETGTPAEKTIGNDTYKELDTERKRIGLNVRALFELVEKETGKGDIMAMTHVEAGKVMGILKGMPDK